MTKESAITLEFRGKTSSKRRKIFRKRLRTDVKALADDFYKGLGVNIGNGELEAIANAVVEDMVSIVRNDPDFVSTVIDPTATDKEGLFSKMYDEVRRMTDAGKPFGFASKDRQNDLAQRAEALTTRLRQRASK